MNSKQAISIFVALTLTLSLVLAEEVPISTGENAFQVQFEKLPAEQTGGMKLIRNKRQFYPGGGYYNPYGYGGYGGGFGGASASAQASASSSSNGFGGGFYGK